VTPPDLIAITDDTLPDERITSGAARLFDAVPRGSTAIQLRDRRRSGRDLLLLAQRLRALCSASGAWLIVNDRVDVALAAGADGVHLGGRSIEIADARRLIGARALVAVAAHEPSDVDRAARAGANAILVSPIFASPGKGVARGLAFLRAACDAAAVRDLAKEGANAVGTPSRRVTPKASQSPCIYALGGIHVANAADCIRAGAYGVAAIRSVFDETNGPIAAKDIVLRIREERGAR
jgi:thiamine-phosphate pyrophosphorylase